MRMGLMVLALCMIGLAPNRFLSIASADTPGASIQVTLEDGRVDSDGFAAALRSNSPAPDIQSEEGRAYWDFYYSFINEVVPKANVRSSSDSIACFVGSPQAVAAILEGLTSYAEFDGQEVPSLRNFRINSDASVSVEARNTRGETEDEQKSFRMIEIPRCQDLIS